MKTGIIFDEPHDSYHGSGAIGSSMLPDLERCPLYFYGRHIAKTIPAPNKDAYAVGSAVHFAVQGPAEYFKNCIVHPSTYKAKESQKKDAPMIEKPWIWSANVCKEWAEEQAKNGISVILSPEEENRSAQSFASIQKNRDAAALLLSGASEVTFRKNLGLFHAQCRADRWHHDGIELPTIGFINGPVVADLKTCETIERFRRDFANHAYHFKAEYYKAVIAEVLSEIGGTPVSEIPSPTFLWVAVETQAPYRCEIYRADEETQAAGRLEVKAKIKLLNRCLEESNWPGATPGIQTIGLTSWEKRRSEEVAAGMLNEIPVY